MSKKRGKNYTVVDRVLLGFGISSVATVSLTALSTILLLQETISNESVTILIPLIVITSLLLGIVYTTKSMITPKLLTSILISVSYLVAMAAINIVVFHAEFYRPWLYILYLLGAIAISLLMNRITIQNIRKKKRYR